MTAEILTVSIITFVSAMVLHFSQRRLRSRGGWKISIGHIILKLLICTALAYFQVVSNSILTWRIPLLFGGLYIAFFADLIRDVIFLLFGIFKQKKLLMKHSRLFSSLFTASILVYSVINMQVIRPNYLTFTSEKLKSEHKFVFLADLHYGTAQRKESFEKALLEIRNQEPEFIVLGGDITDEYTTKEEMQELYARFGKLGIPVYFIYGNHDRQDNASLVGGMKYTEEELAETMQINGITIVKDNYIRLADDLILLGREDPSRPEERVKVSDLPAIPGEGYLICIEHTPYQPDDILAQKADLQLSGHTHDGQYFPLHTVYSLLGLYVNGYYHVGSTDLYVSPGIAGWAIPTRTESHCMYEVITLHP